MINILPPTQVYESKDFAKDVQTVLEGIWSRNRLPILVGGSGTWVLAVVGDRYLKLGNEDRHDFSSLMLVPHFERSRLYRKIERNVDRMFERGLYEEVKNIIEKYGVAPIQIKKTHGYREFIEYAVRGRKDVSSLTREDLEKIKSKIKAHTKKYAMHQAGLLSKLHRYVEVKNWEEARTAVDQFFKVGES